MSAGCSLTVLFALSATPLICQGSEVEFQRRKTKALAENGQRHLRLGSWARKQGLVPQATTEFLLAVEVSEGRNPGAVQVLGIMRGLDEAFWIKRRKKPSRAQLRTYEKRAEKARLEDYGARLALASFAYRSKLKDEAKREYLALIGDSDDALELDSKGRIVLPVGTVPADLSAEIVGEAIAIDERNYVRDETLAKVAGLGPIHEAVSPELRVRGTIESTSVEDLHALGMALLPHLAEQLAGRPLRRINLLVFEKRAEYAAYLAATALQRFKNASGVADYGDQRAVVCTEGRSESEVRGLVLHELSHLIDYQTAPSAQPSWYREAFAESYGGPGAFRWEDGELTLGGGIAPVHVEILRDRIESFSLRDLLEADAGLLFAKDVERARFFYLESWGLLRYLRFGAGREVAERFARWEDMCRGQAIGTQPRQAGQRARIRDESAARALFEKMFGAEYDALERGFAEWVKAL